jgi:hypothetical protein
MTPDEIEDALDSVLDRCEEHNLLTEAERDRLTDAIAEGATTCTEALHDWRKKLEAATSGSTYHYAVLRFDDRNRYGTHGVPATLLFSGGAQCIVQVKEATLEKANKRNRFAKLRLAEGDKSSRASLVELLGAVGEYADEATATCHMNPRCSQHRRRLTPAAIALVRSCWRTSFTLASSRAATPRREAGGCAMPRRMPRRDLDRPPVHPPSGKLTALRAAHRPMGGWTARTSASSQWIMRARMPTCGANPASGRRAAGLLLPGLGPVSGQARHRRRPLL